jgi:hypothetical protein
MDIFHFSRGRHGRRPSHTSEVFMKKIFYTAIIALCLALPAGAKQGGNFGLGFQLGEPSGISGKLWLSHTNAVDMLLGFSPYGNWLFVKADYLWHSWNLIPVSAGQLPLFYGMGAMAGVAHRAGLGVEGVVGLEYLLPSAPLDVFVDIAPGAFLVPETNGHVNLGIGMRFFF